jgi:prepilin-type N-terminal cleavage/methylation domain-containing protein
MRKEEENKNINKKLQDVRFARQDQGFTQHYFFSVKNSAGFTLIEMLVALSLFMVVMTIALGALLTLIDANKKSHAIQTLMTNLNFVVDDISRNARIGSTYHCSNVGSYQDVSVAKDCSNGKDRFAFEPTGGSNSTIDDQVVYRLSGSSASIEKSVDGGANYFTITSPDITIETLRFYVSGARISDGEQPKVILVISGTAGVEDDIKTEFGIQTTITQRLLDF